jgi:thiol-disulfide isomerase/thioredoxin
MVSGMTRSLIIGCLAAAVVPCAALGDATALAPIEQRLAEVTRSPKVTVVHFWAPWCPNCRAELAHGGWAGFIAANPDVRFVFVTIWNPADGRDVLQSNGVGGEPNFELLLHPNASREKGKKVDELLGIPISWIPTTWVFRDGKLRYAMNFGELHFPMLQQLVADSSGTWEH